MAAFETADPTSPSAAPTLHPSGPLPVHGAPVGRTVRVPLGETGFSVFPLILVILAIVQLLLNNSDSARAAILDALSRVTGGFHDEFVQTLAAAQATRRATGVIGVAVLLVGASWVFGELVSAFNIIWGLQPPERGGRHRPDQARARVGGRSEQVREDVAPTYELFVDRGGETVVEERGQVERDVRVAECLMGCGGGDDRLRAALPERIERPCLERLGTDRERHRRVGHGPERAGINALPPGETRERDLSWLDWSLLKAISPDGRTLLIDETAEGGGASGSVYLRPMDGSPAIRLGDGAANAMSPDGQWVIATFLDHGHGRLSMLPTGTGATGGSATTAVLTAFFCARTSMRFMTPSSSPSMEAPR